MADFTEKDAKETLEKGYKKAEKILNDKGKMNEFLERLEKKLKVIPLAGSTLVMIPTLVQMVKSYVKKEYTNIPVSSIIAIISALLYWLAPIDVIPDTIPGIGYLDDTSVIGFCLKLINNDLKKYKEWQEKNKIQS